MRSVRDCGMVVFRDIGSSLRHLRMVDEYAKALAAGLAAHAGEPTPGSFSISTNTLFPIVPLFTREGKSVSRFRVAEIRPPGKYREPAFRLRH
jgi:hypothetical protein